MDWRARQLHHGVPGVEGGGGVGGGDAVAGVPADGADVPDLGAAHLVHGLAQDVDIGLNQGVPGDMGETGHRADAEGPVRIQGHAPDFVQGLDGDQLRPGPLALPHLDQHVGASGDDLGPGMGQPEGHGVLHAFGLVQGFHVIHTLGPSFSR